ncbi:hypothetical protein ACF1BQ_025230 [Bradyrhizobium sp. RDT10]
MPSQFRCEERRLPPIAGLRAANKKNGKSNPLPRTGPLGPNVKEETMTTRKLMTLSRRTL